MVMSEAIPDSVDAYGIEISRIDIDSYLNEVDYSNDDSYVPSEFSLIFVNFIKMVNGDEGESHKTPVLHYKVLDKLAQGEEKIANLIFRGAAKTTVMAEYLFLYIAVYGELPYLGAVRLAIYVSDSMDNGVKNMRKNLEYRWENSEFLREYIPTIKFTDARWEFINIDGKRFIVKGYGAKTGVRGTKELGIRPVLAVLDDLVSDDDAKSETIMKSIEDTVYKAIEHALDPTKSITIWSGTPFNARDPLYKAVESGAWASSVFPVCEKFPCTREEFRGAWPDRFDYDAVMRKYIVAYKTGELESFYQELMLRIISMEERVIKDEDIQWYSRESLLKNRQNFNFYITSDYATSPDKASDPAMCLIWAVNHKKEKFLVGGYNEHLDMSVNVSRLFEYAHKINPMSVGIEVSGQQEGFISWIKEKMIEKNIFFNLASDNNNGRPGIRPVTTKTKVERFLLGVPWFKSHTVYFPEELKETPLITEILQQIRLTTKKGCKAKHDEFLDNFSMLYTMQLTYPSAAINNTLDTSRGMWEIKVDEFDSPDGDSALNSYLGDI